MHGRAECCVAQQQFQLPGLVSQCHWLAVITVVAAPALQLWAVADCAVWHAQGSWSLIPENCPQCRSQQSLHRRMVAQAAGPVSCSGKRVHDNVQS